MKENVIIGRLIPAGTGFNAYEQVGATQNEVEDPMALGFIEDGDDSQDVVLDDRTARAYSLEGGLGDGFSFEAAPPPFISDLEDDDLMIDDVSAIEDDDDFEEDDFEEDEEE